MVNPQLSRVELEGVPLLDQPPGAVVVFDMWHRHRLMTGDERARSSDSAEVWVSIGTDFVFEPTLDDIRRAFEQIFRNCAENPGLKTYDFERIVFEGLESPNGDSRKNQAKALTA